VFRIYVVHYTLFNYCEGRYCEDDAVPLASGGARLDVRMVWCIRRLSLIAAISMPVCLSWRIIANGGLLFLVGGMDGFSE
jgi:hypothetical protein